MTDPKQNPYDDELATLRKGRAVSYDGVNYYAEGSPQYKLAHKFDATVTSNEDALHAVNDALLAIYRLRSACEQMISTSKPMTSQDCETFIAFAKDRLQCLAVAAPLMKAGE